MSRARHPSASPSTHRPARRSGWRQVWRRRPADRLPWYAARGRPGLVVLALIVLTSLWLIASTLRPLLQPAPAAGAFVVRIAAFRSDSRDPRQGRIVAEQLRQELQQRLTTPIDLGLLDASPASASEALAQARASGADVVIWGAVAAGTTAAQPGLRPALVWLPGQPFEPRTWQGFEGRFALPFDYDLARQPLNGPAVLAPLLDGLYHFAHGDADRAVNAMHTLLRDYGDVVHAELPALVRMLTLWAEGRFPEAVAEARSALASVDRPHHHVNLGAVLLDQRELDAARRELSIALEQAPELPQAHANLGRLLLAQGDAAGALVHLQRAAALAPDAPAIIALLGEAARRAGQLDAARAAVERVLHLDPGNGPALAERGLLSLTPVTTTLGLLEWELELPPRRSPEHLLAVRREVEQGISAIEALRNDYLERAAAYGVAGRPTMQRLAEAQATILERELLNRQYQLLLVLIEQGRATPDERGFLTRAWDRLRGRRTPFEEAIALANAVLSREPSLELQYHLHYQKGRAALLSGNPRLARTHWDAARELANQAPPDAGLGARPESWYGAALLHLRAGERVAAREALQQALSSAETYFPARLRLAQLAEEEGRWSDAEAQWRWLAQHRPWEPEHTVALARALYAQGRVAEAEAQLLPPANRGQLEALVQLAAIYRQEDRFDAAETVLERARALDGTAVAVLEETAALELARQQPQAAERALRRAVELAPQRLSARLALGRLYAYQLNQPAAADEQFRAALALAPDDPTLHRQLGEVLLQSGNPRAAIESFRRAVQLAPASHEARHGLATAYLALGRLAEAQREEQRALELAGGNYTLAIVGLGDIAREQGRYEEAVRHYQEALQRDAALASAYLGLGRVALAQGQPQIAVTHLRAGLAHAPDDVALRLALGEALLQQQDLAGAAEQFRHVLERAPGHAAAAAGLGRALWRSGDAEAALAELTRAVQANPNDAATWLLIGEINATLARPEAALEAYRQAIAAREDWYEPHFRRGVLLLQLERTDAAIEDLEAAVRLNRDFAQASYWLGRAYRAAGRLPEARRQLERAISLERTYFEARYFLGRTLSELGHLPEAITTYEALIREAPDSDPWRAEAERELARLR